VSKSIPRVTLSVFHKKDELLDEIEEVSRKVLRHEWTHRILTRHQYEIARGIRHPQDYTDKGARNRFLTQSELFDHRRMPGNHQIGELNFLVSGGRCN
jgi:hypothetical protein